MINPAVYDAPGRTEKACLDQRWQAPPAGGVWTSSTRHLATSAGRLSGAGRRVGAGRHMAPKPSRKFRTSRQKTHSRSTFQGPLNVQRPPSSGRTARAIEARPVTTRPFVARQRAATKPRGRHRRRRCRSLHGMCAWGRRREPVHVARCLTAVWLGAVSRVMDGARPTFFLQSPLPKAPAAAGNPHDVEAASSAFAIADGSAGRPGASGIGGSPKSGPTRIAKGRFGDHLTTDDCEFAPRGAYVQVQQSSLTLRSRRSLSTFATPSKGGSGRW